MKNGKTDPFVTRGVSWYERKKVTVTGATGLIGSYVVKLLKESGAEVRAVFNARPRNEFTDLADHVCSYDLTRPDQAFEAVAGSDVVMSCAGITGGVGIVAVDPISYVGPASVIAMNTLHACHLQKVPVFGWLSSTTVYSVQDRPVTEDNLGGPPYAMYRGIGESKRFIEKLCGYYSEKTGIKTSIIRPSGAYGRFDNFDERTSHVLPGMIGRALRCGDTFEVWGDGEDTRDLIHAQDVAMGLLLAVSLQKNDVFNIAAGKGITTRELAMVILEAAGSKADIVINPSRPTALKTRLVDITKAREHIGFEPSISLESGIRDTVDWYKGGSI